MDDGSKQLALEWLQRGDHDIETARLVFDQHGHLDSAAVHIQQAIEKYLKGFLAFHVVKPPRIHDLDALLTRAAEIDPGLYTPFIDLCEKATRYYLDDRYPPGPPIVHDRNTIKADLETACLLVREISQQTGLP
jgi:HEPN domain-containing protein